jgi:hypothetical protein
MYEWGFINSCFYDGVQPARARAEAAGHLNAANVVKSQQLKPKSKKAPQNAAPLKNPTKLYSFFSPSSDGAASACA